MTKKDRQIKNNILSQLNWDVRIDASKIKIGVKNGEVVLKGSVATYPMQLAVHRHVWFIPGVKCLNDQMQVDFNGTRRQDSDAKLRLLIRNMVLWLPSIDPQKIRIEVTDNWVTLKGQINWYWQKCRVEKIVSTVPGVRGVTNMLVVSAVKQLPDEKMENNLITFLAQNIGNNINQIDLQVRNGIVFISGVASSLSVYRKIISIIMITAGVVSIYERISLAH